MMTASSPSITFFTIPKSFDDPRVRDLQHLAITSWKRAAPGAEVMLFGDDPGVESYARQAGVWFMGGIPRNEYGTPLVSEAFALAQKLAGRDILCYVNCDILLETGILEAVCRVQNRRRVGARWLMCGRRAGVPGQGRDGGGLDYFIFPRNALGELPPFAVGRPHWDNWMIYNARRRRIPVIDASRVIQAVHQDHGYAHVPGAYVPGSHAGPEADKNLDSAGLGAGYNLLDATWALTQHALVPRPRLGPRDLYHRASHVPALHPWSARWIAPAVPAARRLRRLLG